MLPMTPPEYVRDDYKYNDGWEDHVFTMPVGLDGDDLPAIYNIPENLVVSFWQPNDLELEALNRGHVIVLTIIGSQPPVALNVI